MFRNYLIVALRNLTRHKLYSFINIAGLTVGLTCAIFIILFVRDQLSYDRWIPGTENLYRLEVTLHFPGKPPRPYARTPFPATQAMLDQIPEVQARTRLARRSTTILIGNRQFPESVDIVDPNFLQVIRLPLVAGDPATVFAKPESVVLSETAARKYFGDESPIGKTIVTSGQKCDDTYQNCQTQTAGAGRHRRPAGSAAQYPAQGRCADPQHLRRIAESTRKCGRTGCSRPAGAMSAWRRERIPNAVTGEIQDGHRPCGRSRQADECPGKGQRASGAASHALCRCSSFHRPVRRHDAAGKLGHGLWLLRHRRADPADRLLQFHQSGHRPGHDARARDRAAQGGRGQARAADRPVPGRSPVDRRRGAGLRAGAGRGAAAPVRPRSGPAHRNPLFPGLAASALHHWRWRGGGAAQRRLSRAGAFGLPPGFDHARQQRGQAGRRPDRAPRWWCCNSRSPSVLASPRP